MAILLDLSDEELVKRCKRELPGDTRSYEVLVQRHTNKVYSLAYRLLGNRQEAEDVTQEVFIKVYHNLKKFEEQAAFASWLYRIATNTALNTLDKLKRSPQVVTHLPSQDGSNDGDTLTQTLERDAVSFMGKDSLNSDPLEHLIHSELRNCIGEVFSQLERSQASVLLMRDMDNLSYDEVAQAIGVGLSAIKMRIYRARIAFQELFNQICGPSPQPSPALPADTSGATRKSSPKNSKG